jgi:hypothetical protein
MSTSNFQIPDQYRDEDGGIDENQLFDDLDLILEDYSISHSSFEAGTEDLINSLITEFLKRVEMTNQTSAEETLPLDEEKELYGYGVYNTNANCFVPLPNLSRHSVATPDHLSDEPDEGILEAVAEEHGLDSVSHLRVVEVRLANELDEKAVEVDNQ